jgi:hypothetical protein
MVPLHDAPKAATLCHTNGIHKIQRRKAWLRSCHRLHFLREIPNSRMRFTGAPLNFDVAEQRFRDPMLF